MKMQITSTARSAALLALLAQAGAAPTTTSAASFAGASTADVYPPAGSRSTISEVGPKLLDR
jgi:hypothetical protein